MALPPPGSPSPPPAVHPPDRRTRLRRTLLAGLLILAPLAFTVFVLVQVFQFMDGIFAPLVDRALATALARESVHVPGLGLLLTLTLVLLLGWLSTNVGGRRLIRTFEGVVQRIPVAKSIYAATKGILEAVSKDQTEAFKRVVLVEYPKANVYALGFVTGGVRWGQVGERFSDLLLVFIPTTPNPTSGFLLLVPRSEAIELPVAVEDGLRMVVSGGILPAELAKPPGIGPASIAFPGDPGQAVAGPEVERILKQ